MLFLIITHWNVRCIIQQYVCSHQNCYHQGTQYDKSWSQLEAGKLQLGDFNNTAAHERAGGDGPWKPQGASRPTLQVEGLGYIKNLQHGYPTQRHGLLEPSITAVDDEPVLLHNASATTLLIKGLGLLP